MADTDAVREITEKLETGVKGLFESDKYADYLKTMSRFHRYSTRNTLLIHLQMPGATHVANLNAWENKFSRQVKEGERERGIKILTPTPYVNNRELDKTVRFGVTNVYDLSQTVGKPLPVLAEPLTGEVAQYELFMDALRAVSPLPIVFEPFDDDKEGLCRYGVAIALRDGMSEIQTVSAGIHEITHAKLHSEKQKDKRTEEVEAESVSYAVCQYYGIDTGANAFGYIAEWSRGRDLTELNASLDTIRKTATELIDGIDKQFRALSIELEKRVLGVEPQREAAKQSPAVTVNAPEIPKDAIELGRNGVTKETLEAKYNTAFEFFVGALCANKELLAVAATGAGWQKGAGRATVFDGGHFEKLIDTYGAEFADVFADKSMATRLNNTVRGEAYRRLDAIAYNRYILDEYADITKSGRLDTYESPYPEDSISTGILVHLTEQLPDGGVHDYGYIFGYDPDDTREHTINEYLSLKSFAELRESVFGKSESKITLNYKEAEPVGSTVLRRLLYTDGMFNRELKRTRVDVLPPMGKYSVYAQHLKGVIGDDTLIHVGTDSGYLLPLGVSRTRFEERFVEAQIDSIFEKAPVLLENALAEPEQYARYEWGAITGRFSEIEEHNAPIHKLREEKNRLRHEEAVKAEKEERRQKTKKYDARVDVIAAAIEQGKSIPVGYNEYEFGGKNPVLDLFKLYGIELPLRTQGWVNTGLAEISESGYRYYSSKRKGNSTAFSGYLLKLREAIKAEPIGVKRERSAEQNSESKNGGEDMQYSELQQKGFDYARNHAHLPLDERLNIIAQTFGVKSASVYVKPCTGKYAGQSDIMLELESGGSMGIGMRSNANARKDSTISDCVNNTLARFNPETEAEAKARATVALKAREAEDNANAERRGLKPYKFLNVELCDGGSDGHTGWSYATIAVGNRIIGFVTSDLAADIARGEVTEHVSRQNYFVAGGLQDTDVDFVFNNVGHSSFSDSYTVEMSKAARERAGKRLNELTKQPSAETAVIKTPEQRLYDKFADMFPQFMSGEYSTLRLEAEHAKPLTLEWVFGDWISISHTYELNGEPAYEPMVMLSINSAEKTMTARSLDLSEPPRHDVVYRNDNPPDLAMQQNINNFTAQWLDRAEKQGFKPVEATIEIDGEDVLVTFDKDGIMIIPEPEKSSESFEVTVFTYEDGGYDALAGVFDNKQDAEAFACLLKNDGYYSVGLKAIADGEEYPITITMPLEEAQRNTAAVALFNKTKTEYDAPEEKPRNLPGYSDDGEFIRQFAILNKYVKDVSAELKANDVTFTFAEGYTDYLTFFVIPNEADAVKCRDALIKLGVENLFNLSEDALKPLAEAAYRQKTEKPKVTVLDLSQPDPTIGFSEMNLYGYMGDDVLLPLLQGRAVELFDTDHPIYLLYPDNTEAMALDRGEILSHDGLCGIERGDWERSPVYAAQMAIAANAEGKREADLLYGDGNRFGIYQIKDGIDAARDFRFAPMRELEALGLTVDRANYELVYTAPFLERIEFLSDRYPVLNRIYEQFNVNQPADYAARSVSVSDVIVLKYNGDISSHFVDGAGIVEIDSFLGEESHREAAKREAERTDPTYSQVGNRSDAPTVAELESDVKAGKVISLTDMINTQKNERPPSPKGKPSLLGTLERNKQKAARQGQPNAAKKDELEV